MITMMRPNKPVNLTVAFGAPQVIGMALGRMTAVGGTMLKSLLVILCMAGIVMTAFAQPPADVVSISSELDTKLFESYNTCDLNGFGELLARDVEFYHDKGGLMVGRKSVVDAVRQNICGKVRRELVAGSLTSFQIDTYGLVQFGEHRFCTVGSSTCTGTGRFVHLWRQVDGKWQATRIISYDHQPL